MGRIDEKGIPVLGGKMEKKLYVHIGMPKTGTTAIQQFCSINADILKQKGYSYPLFSYKYPGRAKEHNGMFLTGEIFDADGNECIEEEKRIFAEGMSKVKDLFSTCDGVILSDEELWRTTYSRRKDFWKELQECGKKIGFETVIIVYLRKQEEYLNSLWNQRIKEGIWGTSVMTMEEWLAYAVECYPVNYAQMIEFLEQEAGQENVIVRKYDRNNFYGGSIYADFLNALGLEFTDEYKKSEGLANPSLSGNNIEIKRIINSLPGYDRKKNSLFWKIILNNGDGSASEYSNQMMSYKQRKELYEKFRESNRSLNKKLTGEDGELFTLDEKEEVEWEKDNPYMIDDVIRFIGSTTLFLQEEIEQLKTENKQLKEEMKQLKKDCHRTITYRLRTFYYKVKRKFRK